MKKFLSLALVLCMVVSLCACGGGGSSSGGSSGGASSGGASPDAGAGGGADAEPHAPVAATVGTASSSGAFYAVAAGISGVMSEKSDFLSLMVQATSGGTENVELVHDGELDFAFVAASYASCAANDSGYLAGGGVKDIAGVMVLQSTHYQMLVRADAGVDTYADFKDSGLTVCVSNMATGQEFFTESILEAHGVDIDTDINAVTLSQDEAAEKLGDGDIDAAMIMTGIPAALFSNLTINDRFKLVDADPDVIAGLTAPGGALDFHVQGVIPAGTYNNETDINTVMDKTLIFCQPELEDAVVYEFCKQVYENFEDVRASHSALGAVDVNTICPTVIDVHPGAEAFYREVGLLG